MKKRSKLLPDVIQLGLLNSQESVNCNIKLIAEGDKLTFKLAEKTRILEEFLIEELFNPFVNETLILVLRALDAWLKRRPNPAASFAVFVKIYDPSKTIGEQGTKSEEFRVECFLQLAEMKYPFDLKPHLAFSSFPFSSLQLS